MKIKYILLLLIIKSSFVFSQNTNAELENTATVYFTRATSIGALINFTYFDGEKPIGRFNGPKYMKYECSPGEHLFWARSENKSFIEADLEAGKIYIIDVLPQAGAIKAGVKLVPIDKSKHKLKKIQKLIAKKGPVEFTEKELNELKVETADVISRGLNKYSQLKEKKRSGIQKLTPDLTVNEEDLIFVKKKKN